MDIKVAIVIQRELKIRVQNRQKSLVFIRSPSLGRKKQLTESILLWARKTYRVECGRIKAKYSEICLLETISRGLCPAVSRRNELIDNK